MVLVQSFSNLSCLKIISTFEFFSFQFNPCFARPQMPQADSHMYGHQLRREVHLFRLQRLGPCDVGLGNRTKVGSLSRRKERNGGCAQGPLHNDQCYRSFNRHTVPCKFVSISLLKAINCSFKCA